MSKYECKICGYIYDEALGEYTENIPAGTTFDSLGSDWRCPVCDAPADKFVMADTNTDGSDGEKFNG